MIYYHLPGLFEFFDLYQNFISIYNNEKEKFNDCCIGSIYGAPPGCIWNGGRCSSRGYGQIFEVSNWSRINNIPCALTFTNCLLTPDIFEDRMGNSILRTFHTEGNSITIYSEELKKYIQERFPKYKFTSSTTKCLRLESQVIQELENYDIVVLDYNFNRDSDFLDRLPYRDKCELLINPVCSPNCPQRFQHYIEISQFALGMIDDSERGIMCPHQSKKFWEVLKNNPLALSKKDVEEYAARGFQHFKIEGRTTLIEDLVEILVYYMVKPEYQLEIRQRLIFPN